MTPGLAEALHGDQADHDTRPLDAGLVAAGAAVPVTPAARAEIGFFAAPISGQRPYRLGRHARLGFLPFRGLGHAIFVAQNVIAPHVEADGAVFDIVLVVEALFDPHMGNGQRHGRIGGRPGRDPFAAEQLGRVVVVGVDVDNLDIGLFQPIPPDRPLEGAIRTAGRFRVGRPENNHLGFLEAVFDAAIGFALADAERLSPMVHGAPIPAFPTVRIMMNARHADRIDEAVIGRQVVADIAPGVVRTVTVGDGAGPMHRLGAFDLARHNVEGFVPADLFVAGFSAVLRVSFAVGVEVDPFHRIKQPIGRINHRLPVLPVRRQRGLAGWGKCLAPRRDRPGFRITVVKDNRRDTDDLAVLFVHKDGSAVRHVGVAGHAISLIDAISPADRLGQHDRLSEPGRQVVVSVHRQVEILDGVDLLKLVDWRQQQAGGYFRRLERQGHIRIVVQPGARRHLAIFEAIPAPNTTVLSAHLGRHIAFF